MKKLQGLFSALLVSYNEDGSLDEAGLRSVVRHNIDYIGIDGLYVGGSTGENFLIPTEVKKRIFAIVKDEVAGAVPLIAQVGSMSQEEACELAAYVKELGGYAAISAVTPFYYKYSFAEIKAYYNKIVAAADMDMIVYSIPFLTGVNIDVKQFGELFENPRIIGVKFTAADFYLLERLRYKFPNHLIFSGFDEMLLPAVVHQVDGAIGSTYNVAGRLAKRIVQLAQDGDVKQALQMQNYYNDFVTDVLDNGLYQTLKACLSQAGCKGSFKVRAPMTQLTEQQQVRAQEIYRNLQANQEQYGLFTKK